MAVEFFETIRGTEVKIVAESFEYDPSVGIVSPIPLDLYAIELTAEGTDGNAFELTDDEAERLGVKAGEIYDGLQDW